MMKLSSILLIVFYLIICSINSTIAQDASDSKIQTLAWNQDGTQLAIGYEDGHIEIRSSDNNTIIGRINAHSSWVTSIAWQPDNNLIVTGSADRTVKIWDVKQQELIEEVTDIPFGYVSQVSWHPSENQILIFQIGIYDQNFHVWETDSHQIIYSEHISSPTSILWDINRNTFFIKYLESPAEMRNGSDFQVILSIENQLAYPIDAWNNSETNLMFGNLYGEVVVWNIEHQNVVFHSFSSNERLDDGTYPTVISLWESIDDQYLLSLMSGGVLRIWQVDTGENILDLNFDTHIVQAEISPDKTKLAYVDELNELHIVEIKVLLNEETTNERLSG